MWRSFFLSFLTKQGDKATDTLRELLTMIDNSVKVSEKKFFFYVPCSFATWAIMVLQNVLSSVARSKFCHFAIYANPCPASHLHKLFSSVPPLLKSVLWVSNFRSTLFLFQQSLSNAKYKCHFFPVSLHLHNCSHIQCKVFSSASCRTKKLKSLLHLWSHWPAFKKTDMA